MLKVDLGTHDYALAGAVAQECTRIGPVKSVRVHRDPAPFALIEMVRREHVYEVAFQFGGSMFGNSVLIHLEPLRQAA